MSIKAMSDVWEHSTQSGSALLMLLAIADMANDDGDCWPGVARLAAKTRMSERNAQKILRKLQAEGELQVFENQGTETTHGWTNRYRVVVNGVSPATPHSREKATGGELRDTPGVNPVTPQEVNSMTPQGVNPVTPKPKEETKEQPKEKEIPAQPDGAPEMQQKLQAGESAVVVVDDIHSDIFGKALVQIEIQAGATHFIPALRGARLVGVDGDGAYVVGVASDFAVQACQRMYRTIRRIVSDVAGEPVELRFEVVAQNPSPLPPLPEGRSAARQQGGGVTVAPVVDRAAEVERLYAAYVRQPTTKDRGGLKMMADEFPVRDIEEAFKNVQFQHSRSRVNDPLGYAWGILRRSRTAQPQSLAGRV